MSPGSSVVEQTRPKSVVSAPCQASRRIARSAGPAEFVGDPGLGARGIQPEAHRHADQRKQTQHKYVAFFQTG